MTPVEGWLLRKIVATAAMILIPVGLATAIAYYLIRSWRQ